MRSPDLPVKIMKHAFFLPMSRFSKDGQTYLIRHISRYDTHRQDEYLRLRADIFVRSLGWQIPVDERGRECDHYDFEENSNVSMYGIYGQGEQQEHLLSGVRLFCLQDWRDSMITNEFHQVGMIPDYILYALQDRYNGKDLLELTRFCVQRGRWYQPPGSLNNFSNQIARDLTYAAVYAKAQSTGRRKALALVDRGYLQVMKRSHFVFKEIYARQEQHQGYTLTVIDLWDTIHAIKAAGDFARAQRMLALCNENASLRAFATRAAFESAADQSVAG